MYLNIQQCLQYGLKLIRLFILDTKYGIFELLKVIEMAKSVNIISSSFLSLMMCKEYNKNVVAHMYCDRPHLSPYIKKHDIKILL